MLKPQNIAHLSKTVFRLERNSLITFSRLYHKLSKKKSENDDNLKVAPDVIHFLETNPDYSQLKDEIPKSLLRKYKTPESMYLINPKGAEHVGKTIKSHLINKEPIIEVNPGFCFLTKQLLQHHKGRIHMYEASSYYNKYIEVINAKYKDRVVTKLEDFFGIWKLAFQDKLDQGDRVKELLGDLATEDRSRVLQIVGAMPGLSFMKYLLNTILFYNSSNLMGRPDLFMVMPSYHYEFLTKPQLKNCMHRSVPALFQLMFDCKVLGKVPKLHYLPWVYPSASKTVSLMDQDFMYIVNITQKTKLPCHSDYLPLLWYFFRPHIISRPTRVIPMLEHWIPGCGIWLITGQDPPNTNKELGPDESDAKLPHMTIFTEFGDLNLDQKLTVFKKFISWPEFEQCLFRATMENSLPKLFLSSDDDSKDTRNGLHMDEDPEGETSDAETTL